MSYRRTCLTVKHCEDRNVLRDMSCEVLVNCNHTIFPDAAGPCSHE